jgi:hypothetical protein
MPGLVIKELNNKVEVKAETKAAERMARASERISGRD